jgi:hypothetical protein
MRRSGNRPPRVFCPEVLALITGIWLSKAGGSDILIMDVEGTDSRERGDEQVRPLKSPVEE